MSDLTVSRELAEEMIDALERIGCQFDMCDGPTLEPVAMVTCFACDLLARLRQAAGRAPRRPDELTAMGRWEQQNAAYMARATGGGCHA